MISHHWEFLHKNKRFKWHCNQSEFQTGSCVSQARKPFTNDELIKSCLTTADMCAQKINLFRTIRLSAITIAWGVGDFGNNISSQKAMQIIWAVFLGSWWVDRYYWYCLVVIWSQCQVWSDWRIGLWIVCREQVQARMFSNQLRKYKVRTNWSGIC